MATYNFSIASDADDGDEINGSTWSDKPGTYPDGEYFRIEGTGSPSTDKLAALRFVVTGPASGATITSATLTVVFNSASSIDPVNATITVHGDDVDNSGALGSGHRPSSGWTDTTASTTIASLVDGSRAIDVTSIAQEIVNRAGWASGNGMSFALRPTGSDTYWAIRGVDYDADTMASIATLQIVTADATTVRRTLLLGVG